MDRSIGVSDFWFNGLLNNNNNNNNNVYYAT
jgi:hypothetical protein